MDYGAVDEGRLKMALERIHEQVGGEMADGTVGTFERAQEYDAERSAKAGREVHLIYDYCRIRVPGNKHGEHIELIQKHIPVMSSTEDPETDEQQYDTVLVNDFHIKKYPRAWDAFLKGEDLRPEGTMLENCPDIPERRIPILKSVGIRTVEELASIHDGILQRVGPDGRVLKDIAQRYINKHTVQASQAKQIEEMQAQIDALKASNREAESSDGDSKNDTPKRRASGGSKGS